MGLTFFLNEIFLTVSIVFLLLTNASSVVSFKNNYPIVIKEISQQCFFLILTASLFTCFLNLEINSFYFVFSTSAGINLIKFCVLGISGIILLLLVPSLTVQNLNFFEFFIFYLLSTLALILIVSTENFVFFYLVLEMQTLCFYVLATLNRKSAFSTEAGLKYFLLSSFMSAFLLLGMAVFYSCLGTLSLPEIHSLLAFDLFNPFLRLSLNYAGICVLVVFLFKIACAPFHFWVADVYEGAPLGSTVVFSIVPKIGFIFFFMRWIFCLNNISANFMDILLFLGVLSCLVGTLFSFYQKRLKRLIIFSSVAQVGFLVSGLSLNSVESCVSVLIFLFIYLLTSFLIWGHVVIFYVFQKKTKVFFSHSLGSFHLTGFAGLFQKNPLWSISLLIIFFSVAGIPPFAGFFAKVIIILELIAKNNFLASVLLIIISSVSAFYYIRVLKTLFFENKHKNTQEDSFQVVFTNSNKQKMYFVFVLFLVFLSFFLFAPTSLNVLGVNTVLTIVF